MAESPSLIAEFRALDRRVWALATARLVVTAGFSMVLPFLAMHLTTDRGLPAAVPGLIWTVAGLAGAGMQYVAGEVADRFGRRPLMVASMILRAVNLGLLGYATETRAPVLIIGALCVANSVLRAFFDPVCNAAVADLTTEEHRVAAYSLQRIGINVGWALGPAIAGLLAGVSYGTLFYMSVPITVLATLAVARVPDVPGCLAPRKLRLADVATYVQDRPFRHLLFATLALFILQAQLYQTLSVYAAGHLHLSRAAVGTLYTLNGLIVCVLQVPAMRAIHRVGEKGALVVGSLAYAFAYAAVGLASGHASLALCVVFVTVAEVVTAPALSSVVASLAPPGRVGAYAGLAGLVQSIGQSLGPSVGGKALDSVPDRLAWPLLAVFGLLAAVAYRRLPSRTRKGLVLERKA